MGGYNSQYTGLEIDAGIDAAKKTKVSFDAHSKNNTIHITAEDRQSWNGKANQTDLDAVKTTANAALPKAGGTMTGTLTAGGTQDPSVSQVRNIYAGTEDMEAGVTSLATGALYFVYE